MKKTITFLIFFAIIMIAPFFMENVVALGPPPPPTPEDIPIDGGLGFLLAAGMAYGAKKMHKGKDKEKKED